jgi:hypothetical protein
LSRFDARLSGFVLKLYFFVISPESLCQKKLFVRISRSIFETGLGIFWLTNTFGSGQLGPLADFCGWPVDMQKVSGKGISLQMRRESMDFKDPRDDVVIFPTGFAVWTHFSVSTNIGDCS